MKLLNSVLTNLFDLFFRLFSSPLWALTVFSVLTGVAMLWLSLMGVLPLYSPGMMMPSMRRPLVLSM